MAQPCRAERLTLPEKAAIPWLHKDQENTVGLGYLQSRHQRHLYHPTKCLSYLLPSGGDSPPAPATHRSTPLPSAEQPAGNAQQAAETLQSKYLQLLKVLHLHKPPPLSPAASHRYGGCVTTGRAYPQATARFIGPALLCERKNIVPLISFNSTLFCSFLDRE